MRRRKNKKPNLVLLLLVILGSLGIGYAFLTQELTINGTGKFTSSNWDVHFANLVPNTNITLAGTDSAATINQTTKTDITYQVTLVKPGDFYEFTVDVVNGGSLDAMVGVITNNLNGNPIGTGNELPAYARYTATYSDGIAIAPNHLLEAGQSESFKVRLEYRTDINPSDLPGTQTPTTSLAFNFGVSYVQADSNAITKPVPAITRYTVNKFDEEVEGQNFIWLNQAVPSGITLYSTQQEALAAIKTASTYDFPFYLKHTIANDVVTESYVEILIDNTTKQNIISLACYSNTTCEDKINAIPNGTYTLRGAGSTYDEMLDDYSISPYYATNKAVIESMFGTGCGTESDPGTNYASLECGPGGFDVIAVADGHVLARVHSSGICGVDPDGHSDCGWE